MFTPIVKHNGDIDIGGINDMLICQNEPIR